MYLALYRKWRPKTFSDVISQEHITLTLKNQVRNGRVSHSYIFTGSRGTGKTTCSKILAKAVNCLEPNDGEPCLKCKVCMGIDDESILDVTEIDAASNNGVDNVRMLRDEAGFTPVYCKYRVFIIDEVHMLSTGAFNALLKIMEEPPSHVIFILATTEIHKVPATILSRCQRFDFKRIRADAIKSLLISTAEAEGIALSEEAASLIAGLSDGGMRDAFSILDQCMAISSEVDVNVVGNAAGLAGRDYIFKFTDAIIVGDASLALDLTDELYNASKDIERLCAELMQHFRNIMILKVSKSDSLAIYLPEEEDRIREIVSKTSVPVILFWIDAVHECLNKLNRSVSKRIEFEMCMVKMCNRQNLQTDTSLLKRIDELENKIKTLAEQGIKPKSESKSYNPPNYNTQSNNSKESSAPGSLGDNIDMSKLKSAGFWADVLSILTETDKPLAGVLDKSKAFVYEDAIYIESPNPMFAILLKQGGQGKRLMEAIFKHTGKKYRIRLKSGNPQPEENKPDAASQLIEKANNLGVIINEL